MDVDELEAECNRLMDAGAQRFYTRYQQLLCAPEEETTRPGFTPTFNGIIRWVMREGWKLCLTIDNYTAPFLLGLNDAYEYAIEQHIFHMFYGLLHSNTVFAGLIVGEDIPHGARWDGLPPEFTDLTDEPSFAEVVGFTQAEIAALDQVLPEDLVGAFKGPVATGLAANAKQVHAASDVLALARWLAGSENSAPPIVRVITFDPPSTVVPLPAQPTARALAAAECAMDDDDDIDSEEEMDRLYGCWFDDGAEGDSNQPPLTTDTSTDGSSSSVPLPDAKPSHPPVG